MCFTNGATSGYDSFGRLGLLRARRTTVALRRESNGWCIRRIPQWQFDLTTQSDFLLWYILPLFYISPGCAHPAMRELTGSTAGKVGCLGHGSHNVARTTFLTVSAIGHLPLTVTSESKLQLGSAQLMSLEATSAIGPRVVGYETWTPIVAWWGGACDG